jgi:hypothetical protein
MNGPSFSLKLLAAAALIAGMLPGAALADPAGPSVDPVTGYRCLSSSCTSVRLPDANCVCVKENPGETNVRYLRLKCYTGHFGHWTNCPVKPRYGIDANER